ncbi:3-dehydroquinate synthase [Geodia barretti]|uniref:3-dehydroquinate synthase n=1 Tax=Geodia barretti TaxID=519541 RepID=A0AA35XFE6_GEOBA|nr:3-dehydroquinate synthase [Geodia barretti]
MLERFNLPISAPGIAAEDVLTAMSLDKKVQSGTNRWVMLEEVGRSVVRQDVPWELVERTVRDLTGLSLNMDRVSDMSQSVPMEPYENGDAVVADYRQQSREFLSKGRETGSESDLHKAAEKGWGAAAWMAKAVAESRGWKYARHDEFFTVMYQAQDLTGDTRLRNLGNTANTLHGYFYTRKRFLRPEIIGESLTDVEQAVDHPAAWTRGVVTGPRASASAESGAA